MTVTQWLVIAGLVAVAVIVILALRRWARRGDDGGGDGSHSVVGVSHPGRDGDGADGGGDGGGD